MGDYIPGESQQCLNTTSQVEDEVESDHVVDGVR